MGKAIAEPRYNRRRAAREGIVFVISFQENGATGIHLKACTGILGGWFAFVKLIQFAG